LYPCVRGSSISVVTTDFRGWDERSRESLAGSLCLSTQPLFFYHQRSNMSIPKAAKGGEWITIGEAASRLNVSRGCIVRMIDDQRFTIREVGYWLRIKASEIDQYNRDSITPARKPARV
jgi:excisionase family DNA binding protein